VAEGGAVVSPWPRSSECLTSPRPGRIPRPTRRAINGGLPPTPRRQKCRHASGGPPNAGSRVGLGDWVRSAQLIFREGGPPNEPPPVGPGFVPYISFWRRCDPAFPVLDALCPIAQVGLSRSTGTDAIFHGFGTPCPILPRSGSFTQFLRAGPGFVPAFCVGRSPGLGSFPRFRDGRVLLRIPTGPLLRWSARSERRAHNPGSLDYRKSRALRAIEISKILRGIAQPTR
jgi:hypothetical protein